MSLVLFSVSDYKHFLARIPDFYLVQGELFMFMQLNLTLYPHSIHFSLNKIWFFWEVNKYPSYYEKFSIQDFKCIEFQNQGRVFFNAVLLKI